ncbi:DHS-like NAD/FAD-binding domain-containing protein [Gymnopus androsaceus JB14]|uniref:DHS-like NAD/FAD-binding domain-containing protein n=1 Tax=Gymnopus androsaceus JB14 TaxID=1447944 RepID=A0A6A4HE85_9AGAR|nr:DHS-like NAD/FAD-binding domain-containing protein [Gymnopus androsaceus JB14]
MTVTLDLSSAKTDFSTRAALYDLSRSVVKSKKIVVVTGAGISCSSGIPDFRSSDGLYNLVKEQYPDVVLKGRDLFDASLFRDATSTAVFYTFMAQLKQSIDSAEPTPTHHFIKTLDSKGRLLRSYTQNIDGLEDRVGLLSSSNKSEGTSGGKAKAKASLLKQCRNVQLHGDIHRVRCQACAAEYPCTEEHLSLFNQGLSPDCPECLHRSKARVARSARALRVGSLRPAIVLYDEPHPLGDDIGVVQGSDVSRKPEMLIIMGTSLKVHGLKKLVKEFAKQSLGPGKVVFVNKTAPGSEWAGIIDYHVAGATDEWTERVVEDWRKISPADWQVQQTLDVSMNSPLKTAKTVAAAPGVKAKAKEPKKKSRPDSETENVPPPAFSHPDAMVLSTPDAHRQLQKPVAGSPMPISPSKCALTEDPTSPSAPSSPSKRRRTQSQTHYSDHNLEASPSKRRVKHILSEQERLEPSAKGVLLFGKGTNGSQGKNAFIDLADSDEDDFDLADLSMQSPPKPQRTKPLGKGLTSRTGRNVVKPLLA